MPLLRGAGNVRCLQCLGAVAARCAEDDSHGSVGLLDIGSAGLDYIADTAVAQGRSVNFYPFDFNASKVLIKQNFPPEV